MDKQDVVVSAIHRLVEAIIDRCLATGDTDADGYFVSNATERIVLEIAEGELAEALRDAYGVTHD